jgi:sugar/nucleoside kinase (ribokinase family)
MDAFDSEDAKYGTVLARFLSSVQKMGIKTSVDAVTCKDKLAFSSKIIPALKYTDYLILNELEICNAFNVDAYDESSNLREDIVKECMQKALDFGVGEKVIVHSKTAGYCLSKNGEYNKVNSFEIPKELIKGSVGAGDAFCAGCLYGLYNGYSDKEILEFASATAVCNLFEENSVDGMQSKEEILKISKKFTRKNG